MAQTGILVCANCWDYAGEGALVTPDLRARDGWRHKHGGVRCPGQEDDDTDDRAEPMRLSIGDALAFDIIPPLEKLAAGK